jgi:hypothetical protein
MICINAIVVSPNVDQNVHHIGRRMVPVDLLSEFHLADTNLDWAITREVLCIFFALLSRGDRVAGRRRPLVTFRVIFPLEIRIPLLLRHPVRPLIISAILVDDLVFGCIRLRNGRACWLSWRRGRDDLCRRRRGNGAIALGARRRVVRNEVLHLIDDPQHRPKD